MKQLILFKGIICDPPGVIKYTKDKLRTVKIPETQGLACSILIKLEARYMMTTNTNTEDGLVNGGTGIIYYAKD